MKVSVLLCVIFLSFVFCIDVSAQKKEMTIILFRHAEKDLSIDPDDPDPELSAAGKLRAERLVETIKKYKPEVIFSSNYKRTRATVTPLAEKINPKYRVMIQLYNHRKLDEFVNQLLSTNARTVVVSGHNSTTPALANLLLKIEKYKPLAESEYDKIFIIKIKKGKLKDQITVY